MQRTDRSGDDGFTLVELLVCLLLLGILSGIAVLLATNVEDDARTACQITNDRTDTTRDGVVAVRGRERPALFAGGTC